MEKTTLENKIDISLVGLYTEVIIVNNTGDDIYRKSANGDITKIEYSYNASIKSGIHIIIRSTSKPRYEHGALFGSLEEKKIPTIRYYIPESDLQKGSYYHEATQMLFTNKAIAGAMPHPLQQMTYKEMLVEFEKTYVSNKDSSTITIYVNDPTGELDKLFCNFGGHMIQLKVSHVKSGQDTRSTIKVVTNSNDTQMIHYDGTLDDIKADASYLVCDVFDRDLIVARSMECLVDGINELVAKNKREMDVVIQKRVDNRTNEMIVKLQGDLKVSEATVKKLNATIHEKESEIKSLRSDLKKTQDSLDTIISVTAATREVEKAKTDRETNKLKNEEQKYKTTRAKMSSFSEAVKVLTPVITAVVGIVIGLLINKNNDGNDDLLGVFKWRFN